MFKSVFAKYETAFLTIITFGFTLLLLVVTGIVGNYSSDMRKDQMQNAAEMGKIFIETSMETSNTADFTQTWQNYESDEIQRLLRAFSEEKAMSVVVTDTSGTVLFAINGQKAPAFKTGSLLPDSLLNAMKSDSDDAASESALISEQDTQFCFVELLSKDQTRCGWIVVCSYDAYWERVTEDLSKTVITSAFFVVLAAMIAAYFITVRTTEPLREMSNAAQKFAAGKFDARVRVRGRDEVSELAEAFNQMAESLENLENMRNSFIANVSHDLRTPMTTIAGFIDGIRDGVIPPEEQDHYLEIVSIEIQRLSRLVSALLDLSRIQAGDRKFVMKPFDICEMARLILISFEKKIDEKNLNVIFECDEDRISVSADHDAIYQVFYNLCHNAIKFSAEGGALRIRISEGKAKKIQVSVYNEGQGIPQDDLHMVFERFYKSDKSRGLDKSGVGLGLFISKTIMSAHGEKIWVESEYGKNCEFFFTLSRASHGILHGSEG